MSRHPFYLLLLATLLSPPALAVGGTISGTVTETGTSDPLDGVDVYIYDDNGSYVGRGQTLSDGTYQVGGLADGTYHAAALSSTHVDELHDDLPCLPGCDKTAGAAIPVTASTGATVDFALDVGGVVSGTISAEPGAALLGPSYVFVRTDQRRKLGQSPVDANGGYSVEGLPSGDWTVFAWSDDHLNELYHDVVCLDDLSCDWTGRTLVSVTAGTETSDIDFVLAGGGAIVGTVTEEKTGDPISDLHIDLWDAAGNWLDNEVTDASGHYAHRGLLPGDYYLHTWWTVRYRDEVYDDYPCEGPESACDQTDGTPVPVVGTGTTTGIDFQLLGFGRVSGTVTDADSGTPLAGVRVTAFDPDGAARSSTTTAMDGTYTVPRVLEGEPFLVFGGSDTHAPQVPGGDPFGLDPTRGVAVSVIDDLTTTDVDAALAARGDCGFPASLALTGVVVSRLVEWAVCGVLEVGPDVTIGGGGDVGLFAGTRVEVGNGFAVADGARLRMSSPIFAPDGATLYQEDFEDGFALGWETSLGATDLWRLDSDCPSTPAGHRTLVFQRPVPFCLYQFPLVTTSGWAMSPVIELGGAGDVQLEIEHGWQRRSTGDRLAIEVSSDGGATWSEIWTPPVSFSFAMGVLELDVSAHASSQFRVRFAVDGTSTFLPSYTAGWWIDRVAITTP